MMPSDEVLQGGLSHHFLTADGMRVRPIVIGHRGFSARYPENTLLSFRKAVELGVDGVELDVRLSKDGMAVLMHDATVDRTTNGIGAVADLTWEQLRTLGAGSWKAEEFANERIPLLGDVLNALPAELMVHVEIKPEGITPTVARVIRDMNAEDRVTICSFHASVIADAVKLLPSAPRILIAGAEAGKDMDAFKAFIRRALEHGANAISVHYAGIQPAFVRYAHQRAVPVIAWTINDGETLARMLDMGEDTIVSDHPDMVLKALCG